MTVEDSTAKLVYTVRDTIDKLTDLYDKVHMDQASREKRIDFNLGHIYDLLTQIVSLLGIALTLLENCFFSHFFFYNEMYFLSLIQKSK